MPHTEEKEGTTIRFPVDLLEILEEESKRSELSKAQICTIAVREYIARKHAKPLCELLKRNRLIKANSEKVI